jgi:hypothetical protein
MEMKVETYYPNPITQIQKDNTLENQIKSNQKYFFSLIKKEKVMIIIIK